KAGQVIIRIFNIIGKEVRTLSNNRYAPGVHRIFWDGKNNHGNKVPSGIYLYHLKADNFSRVKKMSLIR
ncbi:MAG: FlgD immunoglobulin-like domain containing protein, partial [bacterium]